MPAHEALSPQFKRLYHGTTGQGSWAVGMDEEDLRANDIGAVYATDTEAHAETWARRRMADNPGMGGGIVEFHGHEDDITPGARAGEYIHWGDVKQARIASVTELEEP